MAAFSSPSFSICLIKCGLTIIKILVWMLTTCCGLWSLGLIYFQVAWVPLRGVVIVVTTLLFIAIMARIHGRWWKPASLCLLFLPFLIWWGTLRPSHSRVWQPDVCELPHADIQGDVITLHNVRNCDYQTVDDYTPRWETRVVKLSSLVGVDVALCRWGSEWMAHPIVIFRFTDAPPVCISIEVRREIGEEFSPLAGLFRRYELIYIVADERDVLGVRACFREGQDVYLYHAIAEEQGLRDRFLEYLQALNHLSKHPRWYHALTTNCTTAIRSHSAVSSRSPWDWRILFNGRLDELMYEQQALATGGLSFKDLKKRALISDDIRAAFSAPDFSRRIRANAPQ